jgi:hypothetical protein
MVYRPQLFQQFEQFAQKSLSNHLSEINTGYEDENPDKQTLQQAYQEHSAIFNNELDEKIQSLLSSESHSGLKENLEKVRDAYIWKLELKNQKSNF